ncbi:MAG: radical SAM protein [Eubacteriaceae bacterium]
MKRVYIELTNRCNLDCEMCFRHTWNTEEAEMDFDLLKSIKDQLNEFPELEEVFFGGIGEPTIYSNFQESVDLFKDYRLLLTSNGIITEETAKILCENFFEVFFSADQYHDHSQGAKAQLLKTFDYFKNYQKKKKTGKPRTGIAYVLTKTNKESLFEVMKMMRQYGFHRLSISHLMPTKEADCDEIFYTRYENVEGKKFLNRVFSYRDIKINIPDMELKTERRCPFIDKGYIYIDVNGEVISCYRLANTYDEYVFGQKKKVIKHSFGNLREHPLKDILNGHAYQSFWKTVYNNQYPSCVDCDLKEGCSLVEDTKYDCYFNTPSCGDCLWVRNFIRCP